MRVFTSFVCSKCNETIERVSPPPPSGICDACASHICDSLTRRDKSHKHCQQCREMIERLTYATSDSAIHALAILKEAVR